MLLLSSPMKYSFVCIILFFTCFPALSDSSRYFSLRISQNKKAFAKNDFGHCSAVYDKIEEVIYTAAHCYHNKAFHIRSNSGDLLVDLNEAEYTYYENDHGLVDLFSIQGFNPIKENKLVSQTSPVSFSSMKSDRHYVLGYPSLHKTETLTYLNCYPLEDFKSHFIFEIERALGTRHLKCPFYQIDQKNFDDFSSHSDVAGLSGGGVFHDNELVGIIYQFGDRRKEKFGIYYQFQSLKTGDITPLSVVAARRKYQLDKKIFEEIKVPNFIQTELNLFFMLKLNIFDNRQSFIQNIEWINSETLIFEFIGFNSIEVQKKDLSHNLQNFLQTLKVPGSF